MITRLLCYLGFHSLIRKEKWTPSMFAPIVTEFEQTCTCRHCRKVVGHTHLVWDGTKMVDV